MLLLFGILQHFLESIDSKGDTLGDVTYEMVFFEFEYYLHIVGRTVT